ncbi:hypothetical protein [Nocardia veterana]|uniref:DUF8020 domain-containing protein n=1 Tax=Nocardia veterana TaxID=132249 RepID=A0A7X6RFX2_9NOCA|nr:hypothetical protein [Nocardia veterana]NKY84517.1 hypothetical protein [Nocardia veterana]
MGIKTIVATAALLAAALSASTATAGAAPAEAEAVGYRATTTAIGTVITTDAGSMAADNGVFTIRAADGTVLAGTHLSFRVDDFVFPIEAQIHDHTATLTPKFDLAHAVYRPVAMPFEDSAPWKTPYDREQAAWSRMTSTMSAGATIGTLVGGIGGAGIGCVLGGIAGATIAAATIVGMFGPFVPAAVVGCLGGIVAIGALGTVAGQLLVTAPVAVLAVAQYFTTINAPFPAK